MHVASLSAATSETPPLILISSGRKRLSPITPPTLAVSTECQTKRASSPDVSSTTSRKWILWDAASCSSPPNLTRLAVQSCSSSAGRCGSISRLVSNRPIMNYWTQSCRGLPSSPSATIIHWFPSYILYPSRRRSCFFSFSHASVCATYVLYSSRLNHSRDDYFLTLVSSVSLFLHMRADIRELALTMSADKYSDLNRVFKLGCFASAPFSK